jgi:hypothetical protein
VPKQPTREEVRRDRMAKAHQIELGRRAAALREITSIVAQGFAPGITTGQRNRLRAQLKEWRAEAVTNGATAGQIRAAQQIHE